MVQIRWFIHSLALAALLTRCKAFSSPTALQTRGLGVTTVSRPLTTVQQIDNQKPIYHRSTRRQLAVGEAIPTLMKSLFRYDGTVPLVQAFLLNAFGFVVLKNKLLKMLTLQCFGHALFLGTMLWHKLGWRGWSLTVLYLFLGSAVTKVKFADKEKAGIAESRGGRRGPENLWGSAATGLACVLCSKHAPIFGISSNLFLLGYVASMATKLSDTFASVSFGLLFAILARIVLWHGEALICTNFTHPKFALCSYSIIEIGNWKSIWQDHIPHYYSGASGAWNRRRDIC